MWSTGSASEVIPPLPQQETAICRDETALEDEPIGSTGNNEESSEVSAEQLLFVVGIFLNRLNLMSFCHAMCKKKEKNKY